MTVPGLFPVFLLHRRVLSFGARLTLSPSLWARGVPVWAFGLR
jgi:hypothetical protein